MRKRTSFERKKKAFLRFQTILILKLFITHM